jgi:hypothetical protein
LDVTGMQYLGMPVVVSVRELAFDDVCPDLKLFVLVFTKSLALGNEVLVQNTKGSPFRVAIVDVLLEAGSRT